MPPRRMGSISVVVVFSSRLNFSGGPEPPSPATRLLPGPDMAVAARGRAGSPQGTSGRSRQYFRHLQKTEYMWTRPVICSPNPPPHTSTPAASRPYQSCAPHQQEQNQPTAAILNLTGRHRPFRHRAQAPEAVPDMVELHFLFLLVALGPTSPAPLRFFPEHLLFLSVIGQ